MPLSASPVVKPSDKEKLDHVEHVLATTAMAKWENDDPEPEPGSERIIEALQVMTKIVPCLVSSNIRRSECS